MSYVLRFDLPHETVFAGLYKGALGYAPTPATALTFPTVAAATRTLANGYLPWHRRYGRVVELRPS